MGVGMGGGGGGLAGGRLRHDLPTCWDLSPRSSDCGFIIIDLNKSMLELSTFACVIYTSKKHLTHMQNTECQECINLCYNLNLIYHFIIVLLLILIKQNSVSSITYISF